MMAPSSESDTTILHSAKKSNDDETNQEEYLIKAKTFILFMVLGAGANWVYPTALSQQIPYLEGTVPEKLCIATYMNMSTNFGLVAIFIYLYIHEYVYKVPFKYSIPSLLCGTVFGCFFAAFSYRATYRGASYMLYIACALGGSVGALSQVVMNPFMTSYKNIYISASRSGGSFFILLSAAVAAVQGPGGAMRFSMATFMCLFGTILTLPLFAYHIVTTRNIGLRELEPELDKAAERDTDTEIEKPSISAMVNDTVEIRVEGEMATVTLVSPIAEKSDVVDHRILDGTEYDKDPIFDMQFKYDKSIKLGWNRWCNCDAWMEWLSIQLISNEMNEKRPWLRRTLPYMLAVGWVDFNTWGMLTALAPFAMASVGHGDGSANLAIAYEVGALCSV